MAYRNLFISSPVRLSVKNNQLVIKTQEELTVPLEDISTILIESLQSTITSRALSQCAQNNVAVYICDEKHLPCAVMTGYNSHSRKTKIMLSQISLKQSVKNRVWQSIVAQKIKNQSQVLKILSLNGAGEIASLSNKVKLNDDDNMEAVAASKYFKYLFGDGFTRSQENLINARLNYGYAIIRGLFCRSLAAYGIELSLGVHHHSELNAFNLADDLMEVFRPVVDLCVRGMPDNDSDRLTVKDKQILFNIVNCDVIFQNQKHPVFYAVEKQVQTYQSSILSGNNMLKLCDIIPLRQHEYE